MVDHTTGYLKLENKINSYSFNSPELSEWICHMFGSDGSGISWRPAKGKEPNWFWRKMQYLCFGNKWVKS